MELCVLPAQREAFTSQKIEVANLSRSSWDASWRSFSVCKQFASDRLHRPKARASSQRYTHCQCERLHFVSEGVNAYRWHQVVTHHKSAGLPACLIGRCWKVLEGVGRCWKVLEGVGRCWKVLFLFLFLVCACSFVLLLRAFAWCESCPPLPPLCFFFSYSYSCSYSFLLPQVLNRSGS